MIATSRLLRLSVSKSVVSRSPHSKMVWKGTWTRFRKIINVFAHCGRFLLPPADFITDCLVIRNFYIACKAWELECHWWVTAAVTLLLPIVGGIALAVKRL